MDNKQQLELIKKIIYLNGSLLRKTLPYICTQASSHMGFVCNYFTQAVELKSVFDTVRLVMAYKSRGELWSYVTIGRM